jgi:hypothetical protein
MNINSSYLLLFSLFFMKHAACSTKKLSDNPCRFYHENLKEKYGNKHLISNMFYILYSYRNRSYISIPFLCELNKKASENSQDFIKYLAKKTNKTNTEIMNNTLFFNLNVKLLNNNISDNINRPYIIICSDGTKKEAVHIFEIFLNKKYNLCLVNRSYKYPIKYIFEKTIDAKPFLIYEDSCSNIEKLYKEALKIQASNKNPLDRYKSIIL